jgi:hypothetical protein
VNPRVYSPPSVSPAGGRGPQTFTRLREAHCRGRFRKCAASLGLLQATGGTLRRRAGDSVDIDARRRVPRRHVQSLTIGPTLELVTLDAILFVFFRKAWVQTQAALLLFQILGVHASLHVGHNGAPVENKIAGSLVLTYEASLIRGHL